MPLPARQQIGLIPAATVVLALLCVGSAMIAPARAQEVAKGRDAWAFQQPKVHARPKVSNESWPKHELDWFILAQQEARGLSPAPPASKQEWLRRVSFDLIGLPPTPAEMDAFKRDDSADAYAKVVDRLLASPHYGERWGRHWLDLARYTDDFGGTVGPKAAPTAYRYRDWVIAAFDKDMPYDQFVRLQLAGDLIAEPPGDYVERLAGLGFQGIGQQFSGNAVGMVKKKMAEELDDRVDTVTRSLLGLTVSCARCHDHKFDPIPIRDYYSLAAAYNGADWVSERPLASPAEVAARQKWTKEVAEAKAKSDAILSSEGKRVGQEEIHRSEAYLLAAWKQWVLTQRKAANGGADAAQRAGLRPVYLARWVKAISGSKPHPLMETWQTAASAAAREAAVKDGDVDVPAGLLDETRKLAERIVSAAREQERFDRETKEKKPKPLPLTADQQTVLKVFLQNDGAIYKLQGKDVLPVLTESLRKEHDQLEAQLAQLNKEAVPAPITGVSIAGGGAAMRLHVRGNAEVLGDVVPPGFLSVLGAGGAADSKTSANAATFTRLDLADAIASRSNPLTARVYVNRVWHHHFGRGIVATPSNFGRMGEPPTHPQLLDTLAVRFMEAGWSTKWLHRQIVLSATYRLSSAARATNLTKDPDNRYLWRFSPRRLDFEAWRDAMLAAAGMLDTQVGGPPKVKNRELHPEDPSHGRRTVYCYISRFKPNPTLTLFDFPEPNVTADQRQATIIPQQQLFALNSPFVVAMARALAARVAKEEATDEVRLRLAWRLTLARMPTERELALSVEFLKSAPPADAAGKSLSPWEQLCQSLLMTNEFAFVN